MNKTSSDLLERNLCVLCVLLPQGLLVDEWPPTSRRATKVEGEALTYTRSEVLFWRGGCEYIDWNRCGAARPMGCTGCRSCVATRLVVTWQISPAVLLWRVANQTWSSIKLIYVKAYSVSRSSCYGICWVNVFYVYVSLSDYMFMHVQKGTLNFNCTPVKWKQIGVCDDITCMHWRQQHFLYTPRYLYTHNDFSCLKVEGKMFYWSAPTKYLSHRYLTIRFKITFLKG